MGILHKVPACRHLTIRGLELITNVYFIEISANTSHFSYYLNHVAALILIIHHRR